MFNKPLILSGASAVAPAYTIDQSIRFNNTGSNSTSHYFSRTPSSAGNQKTWTLSWWMKVGSGSDRRSLFSRRSGTAGAQAFRIRLLEDSSGSASQIDFYMGNGSSVDQQTFSYKFRDPSAWYHCVVTFDTTNVSVENRLKFTVNGVRQTDTTAYANLDYDTNYVWNTATEHNIGRQVVDNDNWMDGSMAEIVFIDGTAHNATDFGEYNSSNIWIPKNIYDQNFTFGTNGFYLTGQDASNLGNDYQTSDRSGTTNDWTANNFGTEDQRKDSPTNNFATFNPLWQCTAAGTFVFSDANYKALSNSTPWLNLGLTHSITTGKYVIEFDVGSLQSSSSVGVGIATLDDFQSIFAPHTGTGQVTGISSGAFIFRNNTGTVTSTRMFVESDTAITSSAPTLGTNDRYIIYVDADNGKVWTGLYDNSATTTSIYGSDFTTVGNPATGDNPTLTYTAGTEMMIFTQHRNGNGLTIETEPSKMVHSVVSGYNAINTSNLGAD